MDLHMIAGPLIGAVIGYFTNFIAVKMLFYPRKEVRIFGLRLPFTPGAIPKGKDRLAVTVGKVVGQKLVTKEAITEKLLEEDTCAAVIDSVMEQFRRPLKDELIILMDSKEADYEMRKSRLAAVLSEKIAGAVSEMEIPDAAVDRCVSAIREKAGNPVLQMFLKEEKLRGWAIEIAEGFQKEVGEQGASHIRPVIERKLSEAEEHPFTDLCGMAEISEDEIRKILYAAYKKIVLTGTEKLISAIDIADIIKSRIDAMSIAEMEKMVLEVMKKELHTIVNLGALIGFLIGLLNNLL